MSRSSGSDPLIIPDLEVSQATPGTKTFNTNFSLDIKEANSTMGVWGSGNGNEGDIESLSEIPELDELGLASTAPSSVRKQSLSVLSALKEGDISLSPEVRPGYSSNNYQPGMMSPTRIPEVDDLLMTPDRRPEPGPQTAQTNIMELTPAHTADNAIFRSHTLSAGKPIPTQLLVKEGDTESYLRLDMTCVDKESLGPDQISIGPLDQSRLQTPLSKDLKFLPIKYVTEHFPDAVESNAFVGAVLDPESGKIFSIEREKEVSPDKKDNVDGEEDEEFISWCSFFLCLRVIGLILVLVGILAIILFAAG